MVEIYQKRRSIPSDESGSRVTKNVLSQLCNDRKESPFRTVFDSEDGGKENGGDAIGFRKSDSENEDVATETKEFGTIVPSD